MKLEIIYTIIQPPFSSSRPKQKGKLPLSLSYSHRHSRCCWVCMEILFHGRGVCRFLTRLIRVAALLWLVYLGPRPPLYTRGRRSLYKHGHRRQPLGVPWCQLVSQGDDEIFQPLPRLLVNLMLGQVFTFCKTHQHRAGRSSNEILQFFFSVKLISMPCNWMP